MSDNSNISSQPSAGPVNHEATDHSFHPQKKSYVAPETVIEKIVANTYERLLQVDRVGLYDDFFKLGGDSLLILQLLFQLDQTFGISLSQHSVLAASTVIDVADTVVQNILKQANSEKIINLLAEIEGLSEDEVKNLLHSEEER